MTGKRRENVCHFAFTEDVKVAENIQTWWDIETYASKINVVSQSKKKLQAQKMLESTTKFTGERYEVGMLWSEPEPTIEQLQLSLGSALHAGAKIPKGPKTEEFVSTVNSINVKVSGVKGTFGKEWFLPHNPVLNPNKPGKVGHVCKAASKYKQVCLNDKLQAAPDLLYGLIGTIFRFREDPTALSADIESMFLQVQFPRTGQKLLEVLMSFKN